MCLAEPEPLPKKGLIAVKDLSHFTINVSDGNCSNDFYREVFGLPIRSRQAALSAWASELASCALCLPAVAAAVAAPMRLRVRRASTTFA